MNAIREIWRLAFQDAEEDDVQQFRDDLLALRDAARAIAEHNRYIRGDTENTVAEEIAFQRVDANRRILEVLNRQAGDTGDRVAEQVELDRVEANRRIHEINNMQDGDRGDVTAEERTLARTKAAAETIDHALTINDKSLLPNGDEAANYIAVRLMGTVVDDAYIRKCASVVREYFSKRRKTTIYQEKTMMEYAISMHVSSLKPKLEYDLHNISDYNDSISFIQRKTFRFMNMIIEIPFTRMTVPPLNGEGSSSNIVRINSLLTAVKVLLLIIIGCAAAFCIGPHFLTLISSIITLSLRLLLLLHTTTGIVLGKPTSMILGFSEMIASFNGLSANASPTPTWSIFNPWTTQQKERSTSEYIIDFLRERVYPHSSDHSPSWKRWEAISTSLQDSYRQGIQHSTSLMEGISSLWSEHSSTTSASVREHMTKLVPKLQSYLQSTSITLKETTLPSMHTSLRKCYDYAIGSTYDVSQTIQNWLGYVEKPSITEQAPPMVNVTASMVLECLAMSILALVIVSSIITYSNLFARKWKMIVMLLLMGTISYYLPSVLLTLLTWLLDLGVIIWLLKLSLVLLAFTRLNSAVARCFIILMGILLWDSIQID